MDAAALEEPLDGSDVTVAPTVLRAVGPGRPDEQAGSAAAVANAVANAPADGEPVAERDAASTGLPVAPSEAVQLAIEHLAVPKSPDIAAGDDWAEAGRAVLRFHLGRMLARVPGTIAGEDPEELHAMRVATRRVRAAWRVFGDAFERPVVRGHVGELRALGGQLGAVRDMDVQIGILGTYQARGSKRDRAGLAPLLEAERAERDARHGVLLERLESPWFTAFVVDHEALVTTPGAAARPTAPFAPSTVRTRIPSIAWGAYEAVWAFDDRMAVADETTLHALRIATKWLRYTLEFVRDPLEPDATEQIRRVVVLQDQLGDIHDFHAAAARARAFIPEADDLRPAQRAAIERFAVSQEARVARLRRRLGPAWRGVADADFRLRLGRSLARL